MIKIHFLGVRGSTPCCDSRYSQYGGHTSCVLVEANNQIYIFDAGSGIINASAIGLNHPEKLTNLFFSHVHLDHMMGLPFYFPFWKPDHHINIHAGSLARYGGIEAFLKRILCEPLFPVPFTAFPAQIVCSDFVAGHKHIFGPVTISTFELNHPNGAVAYRLNFNDKSVCYVTDHEHGDNSNREGLVEFIRGTDVFIYDSSYDDNNYANYKGWGHSTWQEALRLGNDAQVVKTAIFHHDPHNTDEKMVDIEAAVLAFSEKGFVTRQGMVLTI